MGKWIIPPSTIDHLVEGDRGIAVWSLQRLIGVTADGIYGSVTKARVETLQRANNLFVDGKAGPVTQRTLIASLIAHADGGTPDGLLIGVAAGESGLLLGAVNWQVAGGVDCGVFQRRVFDASEGDDVVVEQAFDVALQRDKVAKSLTSLAATFLSSPGTRDGYLGMPANEKSWRLAALNHNWPAGASTLSKVPITALGLSWLVPQPWVTDHGYHFPDGVAIRTPLDWAHMYAGVLGAGVHGTAGSVTKLVTDWTP